MMRKVDYRISKDKQRTSKLDQREDELVKLVKIDLKIYQKIWPKEMVLEPSEVEKVEPGLGETSK